MLNPDISKIHAKLERVGTKQVREKLLMGVYAKYKIPIIKEWLRQREDVSLSPPPREMKLIVLVAPCEILEALSFSHMVGQCFIEQPHGGYKTHGNNAITITESFVRENHEYFASQSTKYNVQPNEGLWGKIKKYLSKFARSSANPTLQIKGK